MKQILVFCLILIFLTSCTVPYEKINYPLSIDGTVTAICDGYELTALVSCNGGGKMTVEISKPIELNGTVLSFADGMVTVTNDDISLTYDNAVADKIPLYQISVVLEHINSQKPDFTSVGDGFSADLQIDDYSVKVILDSSQNVKSIRTEKCIFEFS